MRCPKCSSTDTKVLETRTGKGAASIRRRRQCIECSHRFSTIEEILREDAVVVKRDGRRESAGRLASFPRSPESPRHDLYLCPRRL